MPVVLIALEFDALNAPGNFRFFEEASYYLLTLILMIPNDDKTFMIVAIVTCQLRVLYGTSQTAITKFQPFFAKITILIYRQILFAITTYLTVIMYTFALIG